MRNVMTEPDEALLYARQDYAETFRRFKPHISEEILQGKWDDDAGVMLPAHGYRAGAAASAERIKALEARVVELEGALKPLAALAEKIGTKPKDESCWCGQDGAVIRFGDIRRARALLKAPDQ